MTKDVRLTLVDLAMTLGFLGLAIAVAWWWALFAVGSAYVGHRQLRLAARSVHGPDTTPR